MIHKIEILEKELTNIDWDISYYMEQLAKAKYMKSIIQDELDSINKS